MTPLSDSDRLKAAEWFESAADRLVRLHRTESGWWPVITDKLDYEELRRLARAMRGSDEADPN